MAGEEGIDGRLQYASDLFEAATVERMLWRFKRLLEGVVDDAGRPLLDYVLDDAPANGTENRLRQVTEGGTADSNVGASPISLPTEDDFDFDWAMTPSDDKELM